MKSVRNSTKSYKIKDNEDVHPMGRGKVVTIIKENESFVWYTYDYMVGPRTTYCQPRSFFFNNTKELG